LLAAALLVLAVTGTGKAAGLGYSGSILGQEDSAGNIVQTRTHNLNLGAGQIFTNYLVMSELVRYNHKWNAGKISEQLAQSVELVNSNQLFRANISGSKRLNVEDGQDRLETTNIEAGWKSTWKFDFVPDFLLLVGRQNSHDNFVTVQPEKEQTSLNTNVDWQVSAFHAYYGYRVTDDDSGHGLLVQNTEAHQGQLDFRQTYWEKRLMVNFRQGYSKSRREFERISATAGALLPLTLSEVLTGPDSTPADFIESPLVVANPQMQDSDQATPAYSVPNSTADNVLRLRVTGQTVDRIYLYTQDDLGAGPAGLTWRLYTTDDLFNPWVAGGPPTVTYNSGQRRFELSIPPLAAEYVKLVLDNSLVGPPTINFTEVEVFNSNLVASVGSVNESVSHLTSLDLGSQLSQNWLVGYHLDFSRQESVGNPVQKSDKSGHRVNLQYRSADSTLLSRISYAQQQSEAGVTDTTESVRKNYSFDLDKSLLATLSVGFGINKSEQYLSSQLVTERLSYRFDTTAQLYPDLSMSFAVDFNESESFRTANLGKLESNNVVFKITSRLRPEIALTLIESYSGQKGGLVSEERYDTGFLSSWQVSDALVVTASGAYSTNNTGDDDKLNFATGIDLAFTERLLLKIAYAVAKTEENIQAGQARLHWTPKKGIRCQGGFDYTQSSGQVADNMALVAEVAVNFRVP
jgi:hypothetical protein